MARPLLTLGKANPKTGKGESRGYLTAVLHLAPANAAGLGTVCANATIQCIELCLNTAGRGGIFKAGETSNPVQEARRRRTAFYKLDRTGFCAALEADIRRAERKAKRDGLTLVVRVNGTSDLPQLAHEMARRFPHLQFYDYTKHARPWQRATGNYHLTFSRSESNEAECRAALRHGINVAVVFSTKRGRPLPARYFNRPVIDGDVTDLRFLDPVGVVVGLRAKGEGPQARWRIRRRGVAAC